MPSYSPSIRKENISKIMTGSPIRTGEKLFGAGRQDVYAIDLAYLTYNPENSRFRAEAKTFEADNGRKLDITKDYDYQKVEEFIWTYKQKDNENTVTSLLRDGQQQYGIVTKDGLVLSGNRRLRMLNEIQRHPEKYQSLNPERFQELSKFEAIVIDEENIGLDRMIELEVHYQFGEESKVEYDPIQKYLAAYDQKHINGFDEGRIARNFNVKKTEVIKWFEVYDLMVEYLEYSGQENRFTALRELEDPFLNLRSKLKPLISYTTTKVKWAYEDMDIEVLKYTYFDYLLARDALRGEKSYREIPKFFEDETTWKNLTNGIEQKLRPIDDFKKLDDYEKSNPGATPDTVADIRRSDFATTNKDVLENNFATANFRTMRQSVEPRPLDKLAEIALTLTETINMIQGMRRRGLTVKDEDTLLSDADDIIATVEILKNLVLNNESALSSARD